ncbi:MAG: rRNA maturation RNase YbeY [Planctomycetota bacterium]
MSGRSSSIDVALLIREPPCDGEELEALIRRAVQAAARAVNRRTPELSVAVVGDRRMRRLNREFHGVDATTDVLAFPLEGQPGPSGEIIVSAACARRRARSRDLSPVTELLLYVVHGALHLLGESDSCREGASRMRHLERTALSRIGHHLPQDHVSGG